MQEPFSFQMAQHVKGIYHPGMMKWHYEHGLVIMACLEADPSLFSWAYGLYDPMIARDGSIVTYREGEFNLDQINPGRNLFTLYRKTGNSDSWMPHACCVPNWNTNPEQRVEYSGIRVSIHGKSGSTVSIWKVRFMPNTAN